MSVNCPYNPAHIMPPERLQNHLIICQAPNKHQFAKCRYNCAHVLKKQKIEQHQQKCPDRKYCKIVGDSDWDLSDEQQEKKNVSKKDNKIIKNQGNFQQNNSKINPKNQSQIQKPDYRKKIEDTINKNNNSSSSFSKSHYITDMLNSDQQQQSWSKKDSKNISDLQNLSLQDKNQKKSKNQQKKEKKQYSNMTAQDMF